MTDIDLPIDQGTTRLSSEKLLLGIDGNETTQRPTAYKYAEIRDFEMFKAQ